MVAYISRVRNTKKVARTDIRVLVKALKLHSEILPLEILPTYWNRPCQNTGHSILHEKHSWPFSFKNKHMNLIQTAHKPGRTDVCIFWGFKFCQVTWSYVKRYGPAEWPDGQCIHSTCERFVFAPQPAQSRVDSEDPLGTSDIECRRWCIHPGFKTHGQSQPKSETESTCGSTITTKNF